MKLSKARLALAPVCGNCYDYADEDSKIVKRERGWVHVFNNSRRCPGQGADGTDDKAFPLRRNGVIITTLEGLGLGLDDAGPET